LQEIWMAETSKDAEAAFDAFIAAYELKYDKAAECLAPPERLCAALWRWRISSAATVPLTVRPMPAI
jgi:hypothetical protein